MRGYLQTALENIPLWHERDISHSSAERVILPDATILLDYMLHRFTSIVSGMVVHTDAMRRNLDPSGGLIFSGTVLLELARRGVSREEAYERVQAAAMQARDTGVGFKATMKKDPQIAAHLPAAEIDRCFDIDHHLRHIDALFTRAFGRT